MLHRKAFRFSFIAIFVLAISQFCYGAVKQKTDSLLPKTKKLAGHLEPFGSHRKPEGQVMTLKDFPEPKVFYEKFVKPGVPVMFKGVAAKSLNLNALTDEALR